MEKLWKNVNSAGAKVLPCIHGLLIKKADKITRRRTTVEHLEF